MTGARAACFDFSGDRPPHPYRQDRDEGPDYIPRVLGFQDGSREKCVAWAPGGAILATVDAVGVVRLWNLRGRLKKGGQGHPQQPQFMKPQFFLFPQLDAAHPSGDAAKPIKGPRQCASKISSWFAGFAHRFAIAKHAAFLI